MKVVETYLNGCFQIYPLPHEDDRGTFVKTFHKDAFKNLKLCSSWAEEYYSISNKDVIRGMHFQTPPYDHDKLVYCTSGSVLDVIIDLRINSETYLEHIAIELSSVLKNQMYIPKGMAHGFLSLEDMTTMVYKTSTVHAPKNDMGILWDSFGMNWPKSNYIISERDKNFQTLKEFKSPFKNIEK